MAEVPFWQAMVEEQDRELREREFLDENPWIEVGFEEARELVPKTRPVVKRREIVRRWVDLETGELRERIDAKRVVEREPIPGQTEWALKEGYRVDSETGKITRRRLAEDVRPEDLAPSV